MRLPRRTLVRYMVSALPIAVALRLIALAPRGVAAGVKGIIEGGGRDSGSEQQLEGHSNAVQSGHGSADASRDSSAQKPATGPIQLRDYAGPVKVACVGDSITAGAGTSNETLFSYPSQLARMLGDKWKVRNFGVSGTTLLNAGDMPYQRQPALAEALSFQPDVVVILLGANDTKPQNWKFKQNFVPDYLDLISHFRDLPCHPRIFPSLPIWCFSDGAYGINEAGIEEQLPMIRALADSQHLDLIDLHTPWAGQDALAPDHVHPNNDGAALIARTVYKALTGGEYTGPSVQSARALLARAIRSIAPM